MNSQDPLASRLLMVPVQFSCQGVDVKTIGYVLADFPVFSETFVGDEIRAVRRSGATAIPIVMNLRSGSAQADDLALAREAELLSAELGGVALARLMSAPRMPGGAFRFVRNQSRLRARSLLWNGLKIASIARRTGCSHLHAHFAGGAAAHAIVAARIAGLSVSFVCHGHDVYAEPEDLDLKLCEANLVVAVCEDLASDLRALSPQAKIITVACGIDETLYKPRQDAGDNGRMLFVGRLVEQKGFDDLLRALASIGQGEIDVVGDGPMRHDYELEVARLGLSERVRFLGAQPREWLREFGPDYIGLVAPFKVASDGARDTGPLVVKEAMAMGLPVVSTRFMGVKEIVTPETGFLATPADWPSLASSINQLLQLSPTERIRMGRAARDRVTRLFTQDAQARALIAAFAAG